MSLLKSELSSSLPTIQPDSRPQIFETYDSIGQDLHVLLEDWQTGREDLLRLFAEEEEVCSVADLGVGTSVDIKLRKCYFRHGIQRLALYRSNMSTIFMCPFILAQYTAVLPSMSCLFTSALCSNSIPTTFSYPL
jgi:hypothetical protein